MDLTGLYNGIMQLIFIVTGLVSIKSLTEMITQLVGQGDALKDGADTMKEAKKMAGQATGAALHGASLAAAGVRGAAAVGGAIADSAAVDKLKDKAGGLKNKVGGKVNDHIANSDGIISRGIKGHRDRVAADNKYSAYSRSAKEMHSRSEQLRKEADDKDKRGDKEGARIARDHADRYEKGAKVLDAKVKDMKDNGVNGRQVSRRGEARAAVGKMSVSAKDGVATAKRWYAKGSEAIGFKDGIGVKAALKGDASKDTVINKFLYGGADNKNDETNVYNQIKNTNKFVFNVTGMKGDIKDFLDNADVLETIEAGNTTLARQVKEIVSHTGAKSDRAKAERSTADQAKATGEQTAKALNSTLSNITAQLAAIQEELKKTK